MPVEPSPQKRIEHVAPELRFQKDQEQRALLDALIQRSGIRDPRGVARLRVELANYFAAAVLMPYAAFLAEARALRSVVARG